MGFAPRIGRRGVIAALCGCAFLFAVFSLAGDKGFVRLGRMLDLRTDLDARVHALAVENARLEEEVRRLKDDPSAVEALARTRLNMVRPGEVVYVFPSTPEEGSR